MTSDGGPNHRILVIDDTASIHDDFRKTLMTASGDGELDLEEAALFGEDVAAAAPASRMSFALDSAMQGEEGHRKVRQALQEGQPYSLAFVDMRMPPGWDGLRTIEEIWKEDPNLQIVICTAYSDYSWDQMIDRLGVNDKLLILKKPFDHAEVSQLAIALTEKWALGRKAAMKLEELEQIVEQRTTELRLAALHDKLTDLPNRAQFTDRLRRAVDHWRTGQTPFAALFLDFDRFKIINDSLGHEIGDMLLIGVATRIRAALTRRAAGRGQSDEWMAARLGGDEFVVLLEGSDATDAMEAAAHLLDELRPPYTLRGNEVYSTASIGITTSEIAYDRPEDVIRDADAAMYRAKAGGGDGYALFDQSMHEEAMNRLQLESVLRRAHIEDRFELYYQPIVSTETARIVSLEALLRWHHPDRGIVSPDVFIDIAEETGVILPIGHWVMEQAARQIKDWRERYPEQAGHIDIAVNLSKRQLLEPSFTSQVRELLNEVGVPPQALKLEVTESFVIEKAEVVAPILCELRELGVGLSMDDFGTGHSSLNCLHKFPTHVLKIDRAFIGNMEKSMQYAAVVQAIVTLAGNLGMQVVAEGIETLEQLAQIQALECEFGQGYFFSRPVPAAEAEMLIAADEPLVRHHLTAG